MRKNTPFLQRFVNLSIFIILEGLAIFMINKSSLIHNSAIIKGIYSVSSFFGESVSNIGEYFSLKGDNIALSEENCRLRETNDSLLKYVEEFMEVFPDSTLTSYSRYTYIPAKVISNRTDNQHNTIIIDKGRKDGLSEDLGVITSKGVIGYIKSVSENYSLISSFLDTDNMISATICSSNTFGTLSWGGKSTKKGVLKDIPIHTEIIPGDTVVTSGFSFIYPPNLPIATISGKSKNNGINYDLEVELLEDFKSIKHVYIVDYKGKKEIETLTNKGTSHK